MHYIAWTDDEIVGYRCEQDPNKTGAGDSLSTANESECYYCRKKIRLVWNVYIEEVKDPLEISIQEALGGPK